MEERAKEGYNSIEDIVECYFTTSIRGGFSDFRHSHAYKPFTTKKKMLLMQYFLSVAYLYRIVLVKNWRGRTSKMINLINLN